MPKYKTIDKYNNEGMPQAEHEMEIITKMEKEWDLISVIHVGCWTRYYFKRIED